MLRSCSLLAGTLWLWRQGASGSFASKALHAEYLTLVCLPVLRAETDGVGSQKISTALHCYENFGFHSRVHQGICLGTQIKKVTKP